MTPAREPLRPVKWIVPVAILAALFGGSWAAGLIGFEDEGDAGRCLFALLWEACDHVPPQTFEDATGIAFPRGTTLESSESDGWDFFHRLRAEGNLLLPPGVKVRGHGCAYPFGPPATSAKSDAYALSAEWKREGMTSVIACEFGKPAHAGGWLLLGFLSSGLERVHIAIEFTDDWSNDGPEPRPSLVPLSRYR